MSYILTRLNDQYVEIDGLIDGTTKDSPSPTYVNNASGTLKVLDPSGTPVVIGPASTTSVAMTYIASSNGGYRALITAAFIAPAGRFYTTVIDLTTPGGGVAHWELPTTVRPRIV